jgi:integrase/recombinase XerD
MQDTDDYPPEVSWIKPEGCGVERNRIPEEILEPDEIKRMINAMTNSRNRALLATMFNSGTRIGELLFVKIKHIEFQKNNTAKMMVTGKTGRRRLLLISCIPYLQEWLNEHPDPSNKESYVWVKKDNTLLDTMQSVISY